MSYLLPRQTLFANPSRLLVKLSPSGSRIGFLAPLNDTLNVWVAPTQEPDRVAALTREASRSIRHFRWAYTDRHILYIQDQEGDENWRLYSVGLEDRTVRALSSDAGAQIRFQHLSPRLPGEVLVGINQRNPRLHDVYRLDLATGERALVYENPGFVRVLADDDLQVRVAVRMTDTGGLEVLARAAHGHDWTTVASVPLEDAVTTYPVGLDADGTTLYLVDSRRRDTSALFAVDLASGRRRLLAQEGGADVGDVLVHPTTRRVQAVAFTRAQQQWRILDPALREDFRRLRAALGGKIDIVSRSLDDRCWIVASEADVAPLRYTLYHRETHRVQVLFNAWEGLQGAELARMRPVALRARDGLQLCGYCTLPPGGRRRNDRPASPLPMVLLVHGGPWEREVWGFRPDQQWLANRGYAVLTLNFRGSSGFGKRFVNAGDGEWGGRMNDDLVDGVRWAVEQGIADPSRVAIMGGSYGGYAALMALGCAPELFVCGVAIAAPSDLVTFLRSLPAYWQPLFEIFARRVGDPRTAAGCAALAARSPLAWVERMRRPLLIGQGANDPRVPRAESDQLAAALHRRGVPVTYVVYPDEGHAFVRAENRLSFYAIVEGFLARHLGGRCEPLGGDLAGSSITVPLGAGEVPDLAA